jgi:hypothetical protein
MTSLAIQEGLAAPARVIKSYITREMEDGGLLADVEELVSSNMAERIPDPPGIWISEGITTVDDKKSTNLSHTNFLKTPFEFVCVDYDSDGIEETMAAARNLATRTAASVLKNFNRVKSRPTDPDRLFSTVRFAEFKPAGELRIEGKSEAVGAASIVFDFVYPIQWLHCDKLDK